jgi:uncharacterized ferredoxin-like protein
MIYRSDETEKSAAFETAKLMCAAARTAPKGRGVDNIKTLVLDGEDKDALAAEMRKIGEEFGGEGPFGRDAGNIDKSSYVVLIGVVNGKRGLKVCGLCGFPNCAASAAAGANCIFDITDLGIALGSAAAAAADHRVDNRIMYTAGGAATRLGLFPETVRIAYALPVSVTGKSIYFDR